MRRSAPASPALAVARLLLLLLCGGRRSAAAATATSAAASAADSGGNVYRAYYKQVSGNNQDAYVEKKSSDGTVLWDLSFESAGTDSRGVIALVDDLDRPWVVFTVDGGSNDAGAIHKKQAEDSAFSGVLASGYGQGGGPKAAVITQLNPTTGKIVRGTYFYAVLSSGKTNTLSVQVLGVDTSSGRVQLWTKSAAWPVRVGSGMARDTSLADSDRVDGSFYMYYELTEGLDEITAAQLRTSASPELPSPSSAAAESGSTSESTSQPSALQTSMSVSPLDNTQVGGTSVAVVSTSISQSTALESSTSVSALDDTQVGGTFVAVEFTSISPSTPLESSMSTSASDSKQVGGTSVAVVSTSTSQSAEMESSMSASALASTQVGGTSVAVESTSTSPSTALESGMSTSAFNDTETDGSIRSCFLFWQWVVLVMMRAVYLAA